MSVNVDIIEVFENFNCVKKLVVKYRFKKMPFLVADKFGNFYILPHFHKRRSTEFKMLNKKNGYIYYNSVKIYLTTLRKRAFQSYELINC